MLQSATWSSPHGNGQRAPVTRTREREGAEVPHAGDHDFFEGDEMRRPLLFVICCLYVLGPCVCVA